MQKEQFYELYTQLVSEMTDIGNLSVPRIEALLVEIATLFRLSKGITRLYRNPQEEASGGGETLMCHDTGRGGEVVHSLRVVTSIMTIATMTVYMTPDTEPLSEEEFRLMDLVMRTTLSFVSRNRMRDLVEELALRDDSGFRNLRCFENYLMQQGSAGLCGRIAIRYNLRHFSLINQEIGRAAGDRVLMNHYRVLARKIGTEGMLCRLGGDNFVCICAQEQLDEVLTYLTETPVMYDESDGSSVHVSASAGVFCIPVDFVYHGLGDIMNAIIPASRDAQTGGMSQIVFFDERLLEKREKSMRLQLLFPEALRGEEFQVFYQPKVDIMTGELSGAEALCRWFRNGKIVPPMDFIPVLEQTTDICKLDFYMLEHVCRDIRRWLDEGRRVVRVSVNLSRKHMMDVNLLQSILQIIDRYQIPHRYIEIELTETTTDVEFRDLKRVVGGLQQAGIFTSVDDFGMGYSSLNLIREIPWNVLKVDRSFLPIDEEDQGSVCSIMFRHVVAMAKELGLECIAEGVETKAQLDVLRENHCDLAQGFFFDRPLPVSEFEERLLQRYYPAE